MFSKLAAVERRYEEIESRLADPDLSRRPEEFRKLSQEHAQLQEIVQVYRQYREVEKELLSNKEMLSEKDPELAQMAKEEVRRLEPEIQALQQNLQVLLLPKDPRDKKNVLLEIRAGAGGEEAALFVWDLFRLYQKYAEKKGWQMELLSSNPTGIGGYKEIVSMISGKDVYSQLKWEGGVHRVQRVPKTEAQGRIHTSTVTVAVLAEVEEVDVKILPADLRIEVFRASGAGGQAVNTTDSAVRITHIPTGLVVSCQDERSQIKNRERGMKILRSRLYDQEAARVAKEHADERKKLVGTGDRSERIRTYNYPQGRVTDHRVGVTLYNLPEIMEGRIEDLLNQVRNYFQMELLKAHGSSEG